MKKKSTSRPKYSSTKSFPCLLDLEPVEAAVLNRLNSPDAKRRSLFRFYD